MRAIDTNVLARYVVEDDPAQASIATAVLAQPCYVADTVLLELAWLLSSRYRFKRATVAEVLRAVINLPTVTVGDHELLGWAIGRFSKGADFADMVHIVSARHADSFASFERRLARRAGADSPLPIENLTV